MSHPKIPPYNDIATALKGLGGRSTAAVLCDKITSQGYERAAVQLAIQRSFDVGIIYLADNWDVYLPH